MWPIFRGYGCFLNSGPGDRHPEGSRLHHCSKPRSLMFSLKLQQLLNQGKNWPRCRPLPRPGNLKVRTSVRNEQTSSEGEDGPVQKDTTYRKEVTQGTEPGKTWNEAGTVIQTGYGLLSGRQHGTRVSGDPRRPVQEPLDLAWLEQRTKSLLGPSPNEAASGPDRHHFPCPSLKPLITDGLKVDSVLITEAQGPGKFDEVFLQFRAQFLGPPCIHGGR